MGSIFKNHNNQLQTNTTQGMNSAKNVNSHPLMFSNQTKAYRQQPALPILNTNEQSPRQSKKVGQGQQKNINQVQSGVEL